MGFNSALASHLQTQATTLCHVWSITRRDGVVLGFTDHDCALSFDGISFAAASGLSASALQQGTGLSVDNAEAIGALSAAAITEDDIRAGRYDNGAVCAWLVNWAQPAERQIVFRGTLGELTRAGGAFRAELRGLSEQLNQPMGRVYQKACEAVLGDGACGVDTGDPSYRITTGATSVSAQQRFTYNTLGSYAPGWFSRGWFEVAEGPALGLAAPIKSDVIQNGDRVIELWTPMAADPGAGTLLQLTAGCDKRFSSCRDKFSNVSNFRGFPDIPGDDWLMVQPSQSGRMSGGSLR